MSPLPRKSERWPALLLHFLVLSVCYLLLRLTFLARNFDEFARHAWSDVALSLAHGARFDLSAALILNAWLVLTFVTPLRERSWIGAVRLGVLVLVNVPFFWLNILDAELYKFTGRRAGVDLWALASDGMSQSPQLARQHWTLILWGLAITLGFLWCAAGIERLARRAREATHAPNRKCLVLRELAFVSSCAVLSVLAIRGGLQLKPLTPSHAYIFPVNALNLLSLNSTFTFLHSTQTRGVPSVAYFSSLEAARTAFLAPEPVLGEIEFSGPVGPPFLPRTVEGTDQNAGRPSTEGFNVVVIIVESLGSEYMGQGNPWPGHTPFLDALAKESLFFDTSFANGRRSIDAVWSILAGIPSLMDEPFIASRYSANSLVSLPGLLRERGYSTSFFHGGRNGTMFFDHFARMAGVSRYVGLDEYPSKLDSRDYDGSWGIFDEPFLQFVLRQLDTERRPFFTAAFTLSSHNPYTLPVDMKTRFKSGASHPIHESISYADHAVARFFEEAAKRPWFSDTLFVLTGDHTSLSFEPSYQNDLGAYRVPIILHAPRFRFDPALGQRVAQHTSIPCTILDFLGIEGERDIATPFCDSLLSRGSSNHALLATGAAHVYVAPNFWGRRSADGSLRVYPRGVAGAGGRVFPRTRAAPSPRESGSELLVSEEVARAVARKIDAGVQSFNNGMNDNALYMPLRRR